LAVAGTLLACLPGGESWSAPATRRSTELLRGVYKADVRGALTGVGKVVVSAQHVHFNDIAVEDESGNKGKLQVKAALTADGRFKGFGQALGQTVSLSGRLEMADRTVRAGRLLCSFTLVGAGKFGRVVGEKEAAAPPQAQPPSKGG